MGGITHHTDDMILTGALAGAGAGRGELVKPRDKVHIAIEKLGMLANRFA
jgi:hypothetical protein